MLTWRALGSTFSCLHPRPDPVQRYIAELKQLGTLALPLVVTQLAQMGMSVADTMMAGLVSAVELAGVALGATVFWPLVMLVSGILMALTPTVSQLRGGGRADEAGEVVRQAQWIGLAGAVVLVAVLVNLTPLYRFIGVDPAAIPITEAYLRAISWGVVPMMFYFSMRYLCEGLGWTLPAMLISGSALALKIPLNYWFIYGGWGVPAMGGEGCGWASALVLCYQLLAMLAVVRFSRVHEAGLYSRFSLPDPVQIRRLVLLGAPIGLAIFFEFSVFSVLTLLIGRLGVDAVAAHQIASNVGGLTFMIPMALGMAASIRVGYNVGSADLEAARTSGWVAVSASLCFALFACTVLVSGNEFIASAYTRDPVVVATAAQLLLLVAIYQPVDDIQATCIGVLRGYKDTRTPFVVAVCAYWLVGFPVAWTFGFGYFEVLDLGVYGYWVGLIVGLTVAAGVLVWRFARVSRNEAQVHALATR